MALKSIHVPWFILCLSLWQDCRLLGEGLYSLCLSLRSNIWVNLIFPFRDEEPEVKRAESDLLKCMTYSILENSEFELESEILKCHSLITGCSPGWMNHAALSRKLVSCSSSPWYLTTEASHFLVSFHRRDDQCLRFYDSKDSIFGRHSVKKI